MRAIEGEVKEIERTVMDLNEKIKKNDTITFKK